VPILSGSSGASCASLREHYAVIEPADGAGSVTDSVMRAAAQVGTRTEDAVLGGRPCPTFRRSDFRVAWVATRMHTFIYVLDLTAGSHVPPPDLAQEARVWARDHKGGLPGGMQTGSTAMPVFIVPEVNSARAWAESRQPAMFAVGLFPIAVRADGRQVAYRRKSQFVGFVYERFRRSLASALVGGLAPDL